MGRVIALLFHDRGTRRGWVVSSTPRLHCTPGKDPVLILQEAGWAPGPVWKGEKSRPHRDSIPDRPACSQSLHRLSYPAHVLWYYSGILQPYIPQGQSKGRCLVCVSCRSFVLRNRVTTFGISFQKQAVLRPCHRALHLGFFLVSLLCYDVQHYNIHAIQKRILRLPSFNSSTVNFRCLSAHCGCFLWSLRCFLRAEFPDLCLENLKTPSVLFQNVVRNVHFILIKCDSPSLILHEFLGGLLLGFRQVTVQFQSIASGFCYSHPIRMTSVCV